MVLARLDYLQVLVLIQYTLHLCSFVPWRVGELFYDVPKREHSKQFYDIREKNYSRTLPSAAVGCKCSHTVSNRLYQDCVLQIRYIHSCCSFAHMCFLKIMLP